MHTCIHNRICIRHLQLYNKHHENKTNLQAVYPLAPSDFVADVTNTYKVSVTDLCASCPSSTRLGPF